MYIHIYLSITRGAGSIRDFVSRVTQSSFHLKLVVLFVGILSGGWPS